MIGFGVEIYNPLRVSSRAATDGEGPHNRRWRYSIWSVIRKQLRGPSSRRCGIRDDSSKIDIFLVGTRTAQRAVLTIFLLLAIARVLRDTQLQMSGILFDSVCF